MAMVMAASMAVPPSSSTATPASMAAVPLVAAMMPPTGGGAVSSMGDVSPTLGGVQAARERTSRMVGRMTFLGLAHSLAPPRGVRAPQLQPLAR